MTPALVVDDHPITHVGCRRLLLKAGYDPVLEALAADQACRLAAAHKPTLILLDLGLRGMGGLQLIPLLLDRSADARILIFSMNESPSFAARALEAGARGYLCKSTSSEEFMEAIRTVASGSIFLSRTTALELAMLNTGITPHPLSSLSSREHQVLRLIGQGKSHSSIAEEMNVSYKTIVNTCSLLKRKLGVRKHSSLVRTAIERNFV